MDKVRADEGRKLRHEASTRQGRRALNETKMFVKTLLNVLYDSTEHAPIAPVACLLPSAGVKRGEIHTVT